MTNKNKEHTLEDTDLKLLRLLQENGRLSNAELAQRINVSPATCHRKIQRLFDESYITGTRALVDPLKVGLGCLVMVGIVLDRSTPESITAFETSIADEDAVIDCDLVAGDFDYMLRIRAKDMNTFNNFLTEKLIALPGVLQARTFFVVKEVKSNAPLNF